MLELAWGCLFNFPHIEISVKKELTIDMCL